MFHAHSGWYFERLGDRVRIVYKPDGQESPITDIIFDAATWKSIVASVSATGGNSNTYAAATQLHAGNAHDYRSALLRIKDELGVPGENTPAPVAEAVKIADSVL